MAFGTPISFRGSKFYSTATTPTDSTASAFDFDLAFAKDSLTFYQRQSGTWTALGGTVQGPMGINGVDGYLGTGSTAPTDSMGSGMNGIYIQSTGEIYTRAKGASWVDSGTSLQGPAGTNGLRGSQIYNGQGPVVASNYPNAAAGDMYVDTTNRTITFFQ